MNYFANIIKATQASARAVRRSQTAQMEMTLIRRAMRDDPTQTRLPAELAKAQRAYDRAVRDYGRAQAVLNANPL